MNASIGQCRYHLVVADRVLARLDDSHRALEPQPGSKTAGWLLGHLAVTGDFGRHLCGRRALCARDWHARFNPGTQPSTNAADYPPIAALGDTFRVVYRDLCVAALEVDPARLALANPYEPARGDFPTVGAFVAYLLGGHMAYHLGQLVEWCAAAGLGRLDLRALQLNSRPQAAFPPAR